MKTSVHSESPTTLYVPVIYIQEVYSILMKKVVYTQTKYINSSNALV